MFRFLPLIRHASEQLSIQTKRLSKLKSFNSLGLSAVFKREAATKVKRGFEVDSNVKQDVLIYSHPTERFYTLFSYFGVIQCLCLSYIGIGAYQLRDESKESQQQRLGTQTEQLPWWAEKLTNVAEGKYKNGVSFLCFLLGYGFLSVSIIYPQRSVRKLWLLRGGKEVHIKTYSWFGKGGELKVPLDTINCLQAREGTSSYVPMKVKGKTFFFLLDKQGTFHNTQLFDYTVGLMRNIK